MALLIKDKGQYIVDGIDIGKVNELYLENGGVLDVDVKLIDRRFMSTSQRKFIFGLCKDISEYTGDYKEQVRLEMMMQYEDANNLTIGTLKAYSMAEANGLIQYIINYMIANEIPISGKAISEYGYTWTEKQCYILCLKRICVVCGQKADIHHHENINRRGFRDKVSHVGLHAIPLCRNHHIEAHNMGSQKFVEKYHITPCVIDEKLEWFIKKGVIKEFEEETE